MLNMLLLNQNDFTTMTLEILCGRNDTLLIEYGSDLEC